MFKRQECSPSEQNNKYSCLDDDIIIDVAKIFNEKMDTSIDLKADPKVIHDQICDIVFKITNRIIILYQKV